MARPSDPLLEWLRKLAKERDLNTGALATRTEIPRARLRKVLIGREPMLVDELLQISQALEVTPTDLGLPGAAQEEEAEQGPELAVVPDAPEANPLAGLNPWGNQPHQLFQVGVALGCDFMILADASKLGGTGVPEYIQERYKGRELPVRLDAAYHQHINPRYERDHVCLSLGFDALYECRIPWEAIQRIMFFPATWESPEEEAPPPEPKKAPFLRLVK